jgi:hypothetical protein
MTVVEQKAAAANNPQNETAEMTKAQSCKESQKNNKTRKFYTLNMHCNVIRPEIVL